MEKGRRGEERQLQIPVINSTARAPTNGNVRRKWWPLSSARSSARMFSFCRALVPSFSDKANLGIQRPLRCVTAALMDVGNISVVDEIG